MHTGFSSRKFRGITARCVLAPRPKEVQITGLIFSSNLYLSYFICCLYLWQGKHAGHTAPPPPSPSIGIFITLQKGEISLKRSWKLLNCFQQQNSCGATYHNLWPAVAAPIAPSPWGLPRKLGQKWRRIQTPCRPCCLPMSLTLTEMKSEVLEAVFYVRWQQGDRWLGLVILSCSSFFERSTTWKFLNPQVKWKINTFNNYFRVHGVVNLMGPSRWIYNANKYILTTQVCKSDKHTAKNVSYISVLINTRCLFRKCIKSYKNPPNKSGIQLKCDKNQLNYHRSKIPG